MDCRPGIFTERAHEQRFALHPETNIIASRMGFSRKGP
ncbi:hypothetical protein GBL_1328 [Geobacillus kaustophilus GBlys]|uniref:Uncharacterized protein n=1 Tax=Geobacillus kaustophilus GBlys TaxID=1337888 RepID=U2WQR2_GEOKU|nr:hypothetical protein GBL_1328 [Geobacillus kaustophilus GBlys]